VTVPLQRQELVIRQKDENPKLSEPRHDAPRHPRTHEGDVSGERDALSNVTR
jgi:hypothetical protein